MPTTPCLICGRLCRTDQTGADGVLRCSACGAEFRPDGRPRQAAVQGISITVAPEAAAKDAGSTTTSAGQPLPSAMGGTASLARVGLAGGITLAPQSLPGDGGTSALRARARPVEELLQSLGGEGKYVLDGEMGRGGMGRVLRAVDRDLRRDVAIKVLIDERDDRDRERFVEEAQVTGQLEHPNIVPIHELGVDGDGRLFFSMKLVRGSSLAEILDGMRRGPEGGGAWTTGRLLAAFIDVCQAVAFAHSRGVVHRDLKPANIMLGDFGEVLVMDWGLAKVSAGRQWSRREAAGPAVPAASTTRATARAERPADEDLAGIVKSFRGEVTAQGTVEGTPAYMPPEQARGDIAAIDERSDVYALGAILYEILTLQPPVEGGSVREVLDHVIAGRIAPPQRRAPDRGIAAELAAVTMKALARERERRYPSVAELRRDIELFLEGHAVSAKADSTAEMLWKLAKRNRGAAVATAIALGVLVVVLVAAFRVNIHEKEKAQQAARDASQQAKNATDALANLRREREARDAEQKTAAPALAAKARREANQRLWADARADSDTALSYDAKCADARLLRAQLLIKEREFAAALAELELYLKLVPDDADARSLAELCGQARAGVTSRLLTAIADLLVRQGAGSVAEELFQGGRDLIEVYRKRLELAWPGCTRTGFGADRDGRLVIEGLRGRADVEDLAPLEGMPVSRLVLARTKAMDLAPLKGMPLAQLDLSETQVRDISPLADLRLVQLGLAGTRIAELAPLSGHPLEELDCSGTAVSDLAPLVAAPLRVLRAAGTRVADLAPLAKSRLTDLDLANCPVADLAPLARLKLVSLRLSGTRVVDLAPVKGMPLTRLQVDNTRITDLAPIKGCPLREVQLVGSSVADLAPLADSSIATLDLTGLAVTDLAPLAELPLVELVLTRTPVTSIAALAKLRLSRLVLADTRVNDLAPLRGLPLTVLDLKATLVGDLAPLAGAPLGYLYLDGAPVESLAPVRDMPLKELRLGGTRVTDLGPLAGMALERLVLPERPGLAGLEALRAMTSLRQIGTAWDGTWGRVPTAAEFWAAHDAAAPKAP